MEAYGYGHTKEAAALVRQTLNEAFKDIKKELGLKISVTKATSGYGGPRVEISTNVLELDRRYEYIVSEDGTIGDGPGKLESKPVSSFKYGRPHHTARLVEPPRLIVLNNIVKRALEPFGHDNDDVMTDFFDNTKPLFYGVSYRRD